MLIFSYVGFKTLEVDLEGRNNLDVNLIADVSELDEVVVVGYGSVKRKDLTGAVSTIKSDEIEKIKTTSFEGAIASKAAGGRWCNLKEDLMHHSKLEFVGYFNKCQ